MGTDDLLSVKGRPFLYVAFQGLLGRAPDASGWDFYLAELERGVRREHVLAALASSDEARRTAERNPSLGPLIEETRRRFPRALRLLDRLWPFGRQRRARAFRFEDLEARVANIEQALLGVGVPLGEVFPSADESGFTPGMTPAAADVLRAIGALHGGSGRVA